MKTNLTVCIHASESLMLYIGEAYGHMSKTRAVRQYVFDEWVRTQRERDPDIDLDVAIAITCFGFSADENYAVIRLNDLDMRVALEFSSTIIRGLPSAAKSWFVTSAHPPSHMTNSEMSVCHERPMEEAILYCVDKTAYRKEAWEEPNGTICISYLGQTVEIAPKDVKNALERRRAVIAAMLDQIAAKGPTEPWVERLVKKASDWLRAAAMINPILHGDSFPTYLSKILGESDTYIETLGYISKVPELFPEKV